MTSGIPNKRIKCIKCGSIKVKYRNRPKGVFYCFNCWIKEKKNKEGAINEN